MTTTGFIENFGGGREATGLKNTNDYTGRTLFGRATAFYIKFHNGCVPDLIV